MLQLRIPPQVKPSDVITFDAMHAVVSNGIAQNETGLLLKALEDAGCRFAQVRQYMESDWHVCSAFASNSAVASTFAEARETAWRNSEGFKCSASEMLLVSPMLLHFLETVGTGLGLRDQVDSYRKLGWVMRFIREGKTGGNVGEELAVACRDHGRAFKRAYPEAVFKPKNHYVHHVARHLSRDGVIVDAFVGERKHQVIKKSAEDVKNLSSFEKTVLCRVLAKQLSSLSDPGHFRDKLLFPKDLTGFDARGSTSMTMSGTKFSRGDCYFIKGELCLARAFVSMHGEFYVVTRQYTRAAEVNLQRVGVRQGHPRQPASQNSPTRRASLHCHCVHDWER